MTGRGEWHGLDLNWHPVLRVAVARVKAWYEANHGAIVLAGGYGCGKTHIARVIYRAAGGPATVLPEHFSAATWAVESVQLAMFYPEPKLFADIRQSYSDRGESESQIIRRCQRCNVLILDDLGVAHIRQDEEKDSLPWAQDVYWRLIDPRADDNRPILITTNLTFAALSARIGPRAMDRLMGMMGTRDNFVDMFAVPSYRQKDW